MSDSPDDMVSGCAVEIGSNGDIDFRLTVEAGLLIASYFKQSERYADSFDDMDGNPTCLFATPDGRVFYDGGSPAIPLVHVANIRGLIDAGWFLGADCMETAELPAHAESYAQMLEKVAADLRAHAAKCVRRETERRP